MRIRLTALGVALVLMTTGCAHRMSHEAVVKAATEGRPQETGSGAGAAPAAAPDLAAPSASPSSSETGAPAGSAPVGVSAGVQGAAPAAAGSATAAPASRSVSGGNAGPASRGAIPAVRPNGTAAGSTNATAPTGSGATGAGQAPAARGPKSTILIGNVGSYSGVVAPQEVPVLQGAQAWAQAINAKGGINGHPVHLIAADDGIDAGRNRSLVQRMVEQDHVIAFVGVGNALTIQGSADYLLQKRIPVVGGDAAHFIWKNNPMFFPEGAPGDDLNFNTIANLAEEKPGIEFAAFGCAEIQNCRDFVDQAPGNARKLGVKLVYQATPSIAQPDYTAECINAASKGAKAIAILIDSTSLIRIAQSCARQNYKPLFAITTSMAAPELLREPALDQTTVSVNTFPFPQGSTPAEAEFQAAIKRNFPDAGLNAGHAQGWVSGKLFERVVRDTPSDVSTATVLEGLWSLKGETLEGLAAPLTFLRDKPAPGNRCLYHVKIESGKYTAPWGSKVVCH